MRNLILNSLLTFNIIILIGLASFSFIQVSYTQTKICTIEEIRSESKTFSQNKKYIYTKECEKITVDRVAQNELNEIELGQKYSVSTYGVGVKGVFTPYADEIKKYDP